MQLLVQVGLASPRLWFVATNDLWGKKLSSGLPLISVVFLRLVFAKVGSDLSVSAGLLVIFIAWRFFVFCFFGFARALPVWGLACFSFMYSGFLWFLLSASLFQFSCFCLPCTRACACSWCVAAFFGSF